MQLNATQGRVVDNGNNFRSCRIVLVWRRSRRLYHGSLQESLANAKVSTLQLGFAFFTVTPSSAKFRENQGHPWSSILVPIDCACNFLLVFIFSH